MLLSIAVGTVLRHQHLASAGGVVGVLCGNSSQPKLFEQATVAMIQFLGVLVCHTNSGSGGNPLGLALDPNDVSRDHPSDSWDLITPCLTDLLCCMQQGTSDQPDRRQTRSGRSRPLEPPTHKGSSRPQSRRVSHAAWGTKSPLQGQYQLWCCVMVPVTAVVMV